VPEETWLSQEAFDRLKAELEELKTTGREEISQTIADARAHGDIRESAEYDAAKNDQGRMEARIRQLEGLLREAKIGKPPVNADVVSAGDVVVLEVDGDVETYFVATTREERHDEHDVLSTSSPIGKAVLGSGVGDTVKAQIPSGTIQVTVKEIRPT
jgi:transcription elongation factor GreA